MTEGVVDADEGFFKVLIGVADGLEHRPCGGAVRAVGDEMAVEFEVVRQSFRLCRKS